MAPASRPSDSHTARLLVFAKAPVPGLVKTRLMPALSAGECARLHQRLILRTLITATTANRCPVELWCAPDCTHPFFSACARRFGVGLHPQQGTDLGERMYLALAATLKQNDFAIIVGCDCPALHARYLEQACALLAGGAPVVLGPAEDGGYVLIGMRRTTMDNAARQIFDGIVWGTPSVLMRTRERLRARGLEWQELAPLWDVDRPADLTRLRQSRLELSSER